jgi:hypothetical protein
MTRQLHKSSGMTTESTREFTQFTQFTEVTEFTNTPTLIA